MKAAFAGKKRNIDMCNGSIMKNMLLFAVPLMLSSTLQLLFNAADIIVVGRYAGYESLAAVGSNTAIINFMTNFFMGFSIGANVLAARYMGAGKQRDAAKTVHTAMTLAIILGVAVSFFGVLSAGKILVYMGTPDKILPLARLYLRIYFLGMLPMVLYNFSAALLRAKGDTQRPLYYLTAAGVLNVLLNLLFVIRFKMDVAGVGLATVISQTLSAVLIIRCLMKEESDIRLRLKQLSIDKKKLVKIIQIGLPASFQGMLFSISNIVIQSSINSFGEITVAGSSAASNIEGFVYMAMNAFHQSALTFTSQNVGAGRNDRIGRVMLVSLINVVAVGLILGNTVVHFGKPLLSLYTKDSEVMAQGLIRLKIICSVYALCGMMDVMVGVLRGIGYSVMPMIVSLVGVCGLRLLWIFTFFKMERFHTIELLYVVYGASWIITFMVHMICFLIVKRRFYKISSDSN